MYFIAFSFSGWSPLRRTADEEKDSALDPPRIGRSAMGHGDSHAERDKNGSGRPLELPP